MNKKKMLITGTITVAIIYLAICVLLFVFQKSLVYFPTKKTRAPTGRKTTFSVNNQEITATVINKGETKAIIYFGGNADQVELSAAGFVQFDSFTTYLVNYRGYGGSTGNPEQNAILKDAEAIFLEISKEYGEITVMGRSLGSGVATYLASKNRVAKLITVTPYDSIENVGQDAYPFFPVKLLSTEKYRSYVWAERVTAPTLVIYGGRDRIIKNQRTEAFLKHFKSRPEVVKIETAGHNDISTHPRYWDTIREFMEDL